MNDLRPFVEKVAEENFRVAKDAFLKDFERADLKHTGNMGWEMRIATFYSELIEAMEKPVNE